MKSRFVRGEAETDDLGKVWLRIISVSDGEKEYLLPNSSIEEARELCNRINLLSVSECNIDDIIDDFMEKAEQISSDV